MVITSAPLDLMRLATDASYYAKHLILIEDRNQKIKTFEYNPAQEVLHGNITGRDIVIKAGQLGITTLFLARYFKDVMMHMGTTAVVVAHQEHLTTRLLDRVRRMHKYMPDQFAVRYPDGSLRMMQKPALKHDSAHEMTFPDLNGIFYIGTARAYVFGRGEPIHRFLGSEVAFWPNADEILAPALQRVPLGGEAVLESTPNGETGQFYERVMSAMKDDGSEIWTLHTLPWWLEPEYQIDIGSEYSLLQDREKITHYTSEEKNLAKIAGWDDDEAERRIRWRRRKISEINRKFWQEFMEDVVTCFLSSGDTFYKTEEVDRLRAGVTPPIDRVTLTNSHARVNIWERPDDTWEAPNYLISVDPGQGKVTESVAAVWKMLDPWKAAEEQVRPIQHVATLSGLYEPDVFAPMVMELGRWYKLAKIAAERNGHGMAFTSRIRTYPNVYRQRDVVNNVPTKVIGWKTTGAAKIGSGGSKMYAMDELNACLPDMECADVDIVSQISATRIDPADNIIWVGKANDFHDAAMLMGATRSSARGQGARGASYKV